MYTASKYMGQNLVKSETLPNIALPKTRGNANTSTYKTSYEACPCCTSTSRSRGSLARLGGASLFFIIHSTLCSTMPKTDTSREQVQGTNLTVQPTKQANPVYRPIRAKNLLEARLTPRPQTYLVELRGRTALGVRMDVSRVYIERHPLIALGRVLVELRESEPSFKMEWFSLKTSQSRNL